MAINAKQELVSVISWRSLLIFLMILVLMFSMVTPSHAVIAEAAVLVPVVIAALAAFGIGTGVHALQSGNVISWYSQKLEQWANSLGETVNTLLDVAKITADPLGVLRLAPSFLLRVKQFSQWLQTDMGLESGGNDVVIPIGAFTNMPLPAAGTNPSNQQVYNVGIPFAYGKNVTYHISAIYTSNIYVFISGGNLTVAMPSESASSVYFKIAGYNGSSYTNAGSYNNTASFLRDTTYNMTYYVFQWDMSAYQGYYVPVYNTYLDGLQALRSYVGGNSSSITLSPGAIAYPETTGDDEEDYPYIIDYGGVAGDTVQDAADTIMDKVIDNDLVVEGETDAPDEAIEWPDIMSPPQVQGLEYVFPFCIPFDIYHFLQALSATPVAPRFEIPFYIPNLINYTMVIDLSGFNTAAQVFRTMELLAFCIGLAFVTRKLIRG